VPGGRAKIAYDFPDGTPAPLKVVWAALVTNFVADLSIGIWASSWAPRQYSTYYSYPVKFKGRIVVFLPPLLGRYSVWGFWSHFALLGIIAILTWYYSKTGRAIRVL
jgi:hypothetical protein